MFNYTYPKGDAGGNFIKVAKPDGSEWNNLHFFFDSGAFLFDPNNDLISRPLNDTA